MAAGIKLLYAAGVLTVVGMLGGLVSAIVAPPKMTPMVRAPAPQPNMPVVEVIPGIERAAGHWEGQPDNGIPIAALQPQIAKTSESVKAAPATQTTPSTKAVQPTQAVAAKAEPAKVAVPAPQVGQIGTILREVWTGMPGNDIASLTGHPDYPKNPTESEFMKNFETLENSGDDYAEVYRGYVHPPTSGEYTFWISSDDAGELWLSGNEDPKDIKRIANIDNYSEFRKWDAQPGQKSPAIKLEAGKKYYVEARHKEGGGGDHLSVGWQLPGGAMERPIPGTRLSPATPYPRKPPAPPSCKLAGPIPTTPGQHKLRAQVVVGNMNLDMAYLIELPKNYKPTGEPWPLYTFLHGNTHQGSDHAGLLNEGPAQYLNQIKELRDKMPMITYVPQCPNGLRWDNDQAIRASIAILDEVAKAFNVDKLRMYCTGLSMGGMGTWRMALEAPDRFAAITTLCSVAVKPDKAVVVLKDMPMRIICGGNDGGFTEGSKYMYKVMKEAGADVELTVVPNDGHGCWAKFYPTIEFYMWFLKHKRKP